MFIDEEDYFAHYGILRKSGRYPWGSGEEVPFDNQSFSDYVKEMSRRGVPQTEIAKGVGMTTTELRAIKKIVANEKKQLEITTAQKLKDKGWANQKIGDYLGGRNESYVRSLLEPGAKEKADILASTSEMLRREVAKNKYVDVGLGVEDLVGVSSNTLSTAVAILKAEGYSVHPVDVNFVSGRPTKYKVLVAPGVTQKEAFLNRDKILPPFEVSKDSGRTMLGSYPPLSISPDRIAIRYDKDGGGKEDGVMYLRPGVDDLSMGSATYSQVRIKVGDTHYLKGMAIYKDGLPKGVDILFNSSKDSTGNKLDALKPLEKDPDMPFGSQIKAGGQILAKGADGKVRVTSAVNKLNEEGDWNKWNDSLASQVLSKQSPKLAKDQLAKVYEKKAKEYEEIMALTNPVVKKKMLESLADSTDSSAVHLRAAALKDQKTHVILPITTIPENQVYAHNYNNGDRVVLIRFPHAGRFEIPELTVNNNHPEAKKLIRDSIDAIGIHPKVAERLSGADFDGDTVLVIPNNSGKIKAAPALAGLKDFDPRRLYKGYEGMPKMSDQTKGREMGDISNLITDMTIHKASPDKLARAVRHSMVVIDAQKHDLNYKQSAIDHGIPALKKEYQGRARGGASTLISRAKAEVRPNARKPRSAANGGPIDKVTGEKVYEPTNQKREIKKVVTLPDGTKEYVPTGKFDYVTIKSKKLAETKDANDLSSGTVMEQIYADHSNSLKALANQARLSSLNVGTLKYSPTAREIYSEEVKELNSYVVLATRNKPLERYAQVIANGTYKVKKQANPDLTKSQQKKVKAGAINEARSRLGSGKPKLVITDKQWEAIQAGAVSPSKLKKLLDIADIEQVKQLATPKPRKAMSAAKSARARTLLDGGATRAEVAEALGVSVSTLNAELTS